MRVGRKKRRDDFWQKVDAAADEEESGEEVLETIGDEPTPEGGQPSEPSAAAPVDGEADPTLSVQPSAAEADAEPSAEEASDGGSATELADRMAERTRGLLLKLRSRLPSWGRALLTWLRLAGVQTGDFLYEVGYYAEYSLVKLGRALRHGGRVVLRAAGKALKVLARALLWLPMAVLGMFGRLFWHLFSAVRNVRAIWYDRDPDTPGETWKKTCAYLGGGIARHAHLVWDILGWLLPVAAGAVFVFTVRTVMNYQYVLQVSCNDQVLGYVASDTVVETAQQDVEKRIIYTEDDATDEWQIKPSYVLAVNDNISLMDSGEVADAILATSGEEIVEATGFYLDGKFYGAVTDGDRLQAELESIKEPYRTDDPDETVSFVNEPVLEKGVFMRSSIVEFDQINDLIHGQVAGEVTYTVVKGDTPSGIAHDHGLTTAELVSMNPDRDILNSMYPGDTLVVSQAVSFLQVKVTYRRVEEETVPYDTVRTNTSDLSFGYTRVQTEGVAGLDECTYDYVFVDGVLQSKTLVERKRVLEPVTEEILVGTKVRPGVTVVPATGGYMWPIPGYTGVSRGFTGVYAHDGMDITAHYGTPIYASQSGVVTSALYTSRGYGIYVIIDHGGGYSTLYGHCSQLAVQAGDVVNQGDLIAYVGSTGFSTGNHCHFEIRINGTRINPAPYVGYG